MGRGCAASTALGVPGFILGLLAASGEAVKAKQVSQPDSDHLAAGDGRSSFVRSLAFQQRLRICNAYPYYAALDVRVGERSLTQSPLQYRSCQEFTPSMRVGDRINFKVEDNTVGTFDITDLPENDAVLLMVIHRHDTDSSAVSFQSHVFSNQHAAQIAILDTYKGSAKSELRIKDALPKRGNRSELLRYDSVVAVDPGDYEVMLKGVKGENSTMLSLETLEAKPGEAYVVIRCGVESHMGEVYPQSLLVYPPGPPESSFQEQSSALGAAQLPAGLACAVMVAAFLGACAQ